MTRSAPLSGRIGAPIAISGSPCAARRGSEQARRFRPRCSPEYELVYRKQYAAGAGFIALQALLGVYVAPLAPVAQLLAASFLGRYGKSIVLIDGVAKLEAVRKMSLPAGAALEDMRRAGGVNPLAAALALAALVALMAYRAAAIVEAVQAPAALLGGVLNALP